MIKHLKYLLFIFIVFITPNVFARDYDMTSFITSPTGGSSTAGKYTGTELNGSRGSFSFNTRYNGTLTRVEFNLPPPVIEGDCWPVNMTYTLTLNMATEDWRNRFASPIIRNFTGTNFAISNITFVSTKKIYFKFKIPYSDNSCYQTLYVDLNSNDLFTPFTGETNWNLKSVILSDTLSSGNSGSAPVSSPTPTPANNTQAIIDNNNQNTEGIINNNNQNTQEVINNNNQNTQDIIDNNNQNTQDIIDNNNSNITCPVGPLAIDYDHFKDIEGKYLNSSGEEVSSSSYGISKKFFVKPNTEYSLQLISTQDVYFCLYRQNDALISCDSLNTLNKTFTTTSLTTYIKFSLRKGRVYYLKGPICNDWKKEGLDDVANAVSQVNDTIKDGSIDNKTGFFTGFNDNSHGLTGIITLPLTTIQSLANNNCVSLTVPIPFTNKNVSLPCMTQVYQTYVPTVFNLWQVVSFGIISYFICLDIFKMVKGFKDPNEDKVEVLDL